MSRKAERLARERQKNKRIAIIALSIVALVAVIAAIVFAIVKANDSRVTGIENNTPANVEALFVSKANQDSWKYFQTISGSPDMQQLDSAHTLGVAFLEGNSFFYAEGKAKEMEDEMERRNLDYPGKDGVYVITGGDEGLSEDSLGKTEQYPGKKLANATESFGYINSQGWDGPLTEESGIPTQDWTWFGTFSEGAWVGKANGLNADDFNLDEFTGWVEFNKQPQAMNSWFSRGESGEIGIAITPSDLATISGVESYSTGIDDIKAKLDGEGTLEISFGRKQ